MKSGIRVLGVDDAAFELSDKRTELIGVVYRGTQFIEDIKFSSVEVDGEDGSDAVIDLFRKCNNTRQIKAILVDGIAFAGFNVVDLGKVAREVDLPVVAVTPNKPNREEFRDAMQRTDNHTDAFERLDDPSTFDTSDGKVYFQYAGCSEEKARNFVRYSLLQGLTPEPIRVAHLIGRELRELD